MYKYNGLLYLEVEYEDVLELIGQFCSIFGVEYIDTEVV